MNYFPENLNIFCFVSAIHISYSLYSQAVLAD